MEVCCALIRGYFFLSQQCELQHIDLSEKVKELYLFKKNISNHSQLLGRKYMIFNSASIAFSIVPDKLYFL